MRRLILFSFALALPIYAAPPPSAREILDSVRLLESRQQIDLDGQLREEEKVIPFHLAQTGPLIRYSFSDPEEVLQLRFGENGSRLEVISAQKIDNRWFLKQMRVEELQPGTNKVQARTYLEIKR